jgi:hypothetical protein
MLRLVCGLNFNYLAIVVWAIHWKQYLTRKTNTWLPSTLTLEFVARRLASN